MIGIFACSAALLFASVAFGLFVAACLVRSDESLYEDDDE